MTDFRECKWCGVRLILAVTAEGGKLPPANYGADPAGPLAIEHTPAGAWIGRFLTDGEQPAGAEQLHGVHECDGTRHHHRQRRHEARKAGGQPPRRPQPGGQTALFGGGG